MPHSWTTRAGRVARRRPTRRRSLRARPEADGGQGQNRSDQNAQLHGVLQIGYWTARERGFFPGTKASKNGEVVPVEADLQVGPAMSWPLVNSTILGGLALKSL